MCAFPLFSGPRIVETANSKTSNSEGRLYFFTWRIVLFSSVCGQPHRLHSFQGHPGRGLEHLLLDPLDLHDPKCLLEEDRVRRGAPRRGQDPGSGRAKISQILSVGLLLPILSGRSHFHPFFVLTEENNKRVSLRYMSTIFTTIKRWKTKGLYLITLSVFKCTSRVGNRKQNKEPLRVVHKWRHGLWGEGGQWFCEDSTVRP